MLCLIALWSLESYCLNTNKDFIVKDNNSRHMGTAAERVPAYVFADAKVHVMSAVCLFVRLGKSYRALFR